jgi:hypothetical protein
MLFEAVGLQEPVTPLSFSLAGDFKDQFQAVVAHPENTDEPAVIVCSLPRHADTAFMALTKSREFEVARLLANLEDLEREQCARIEVGRTVGFGSAADPSGFPPAAVIVFPVSVSALLSEVPEEMIVDGKSTRFVLVLPLNQEELACRNKHGQDALIDMFQREGKSLFFANSRAEVKP